MLEPPLPFGNAAARWFYVLLKGLASRGHQVTAFATCSKPELIKEARELFPPGQFDLRCYPHSSRSGLGAKLNTLRRPYSYMFSQEFLADFAREAARDFDILHLEQVWSGWLGQDHIPKALLNVHHLVWIDLQFAKASTLRGRFDQFVMLDTEKRLIRRFRNVRSCSPRLVPEIKRENPLAEITTIPVAFDLSQYVYIPDAAPGSTPRDPVVTVIGSMGWYPTRSAAERLLEKLWPEIKKRVPGARVEIVGWDAKRALARYLGRQDVTIEENVADIRPWFERAGVLVYAPGRGSGMKIKILEAMAFGVPVVTTSEGVEGLPAQDGVHAGIAEDDAGLIDRTVRLLTDERSRNRQRAEARKLIEHHCDPEPALDALEKVYARMIASECASPKGRGSRTEQLG